MQLTDIAQITGMATLFANQVFLGGKINNEPGGSKIRPMRMTCEPGGTPPHREGRLDGGAERAGKCGSQAAERCL